MTSKDKQAVIDIISLEAGKQHGFDTCSVIDKINDLEVDPGFKVGCKVWCIRETALGAFVYGNTLISTTYSHTGPIHRVFGDCFGHKTIYKTLDEASAALKQKENK